MSMSSRDAIAIVAQESPPVGDFPRTGVVPTRTLLKTMRRAGWPIASVVATIHHPESVDSTGWHRPARTQETELIIVPLSWMKRLAQLTGYHMADMIRGKYGL